MVDLDPEIWNNKTLGAAANGVFLDVLEAQAAEDRAAKIEGRPAETAYRENRYPGFVDETNSGQTSDVLFGSEYADGTAVCPSGGPVADVPTRVLSAGQKPSTGVQGIAAGSSKPSPKDPK